MHFYVMLCISHFQRGVGRPPVGHLSIIIKSLSEQCEGGLKCCATGKPEKLLLTERMSSVILSANRRPVKTDYLIWPLRSDSLTHFLNSLIIFT